MGFYDIAMLVVLGGAIFFGWWKGFAWQVASLAALIFSYVVAVTFRDPVAGFISADPPWDQIGAMLGLFLVTSLVIWTIYASIAKSIKKHELKSFDRQAGAILGGVKGALLCMVITMFAVSFFGENAHNAVDNSRFGPYVEKGIWNVSAFVPEELARFVDPHIESYKDAVGHQEPVVDPRADIDNMMGSAYEIGQQLSQDLTQLPDGDQSQYQNAGYTGQWQTPNTSTGVGTNQTATSDQNYQFGTNYGAPPARNQQSGWNQGNSGDGYQGGFSAQSQPSTAGTDWSNVSISEASKRILEDARQKGIDLGIDAANDLARQWFERAKSNTDISDAAKQIFEDARKQGIDMTVEAANEAARRMFGGNQQR